MEEEKRFDAEVYYTGGSVAWIIMAHGFGGSAKTWKKQIDFFSKYYNLLVLEMHKRKDNEDLHLDKVCKFINNTLNHYKIEKARFLGFSFSSLICLPFSVLYRGKVNSLIMGGELLSSI